MKTRTLRAVAGLLTLVVIAGACQSSEVGDTADATSADTTVSTETEPAETVSAAEAADEGVDPELEPADDDEPSATVVSVGEDLDLELFLDGAIVGEPVLGDCVLSDGSSGQCYTISVAGAPVEQDIGPFCPTTITASADEGGLWLDGDGAYEIDGAFFTELADIYGDELWNNIFNDDGSVNVIDNAEDFQVAARPDITEEFYYHCVDGDVEWVEGGQPEHTLQIPVTPTLMDSVTTEFATGAHSNLGFTLNGAMLSGSADMDAILASYTIAAFDDCGGHINPALGYHVHGTAGCSDVGEAPEGETAPFAIAIDGFTIHAPYDSDVELDECNGHWSEEYGYHYHASSIEENATLTCLMGLIAEGQAGGAPGGGGERPERGAPPED